MTLAYFGISLPNLLQNPLNHKLNFCSAEELSEIQVSHDEYCAFLTLIKSVPEIKEVTILSTCNRFEIIAFIEEGLDPNRVKEIIKQKASQGKEAEVDLQMNYLTGNDAKLQIIRTYCGLNSGLVGEDEISAQMNTAFRQAAFMGLAGDNMLALLDEAIVARKELDNGLFKSHKVSYCDVALKGSLRKLNMLANDISELNKVVVLGSGNTTKQSCLALLGLGLKSENITIVHRCSFNSAQIENIKVCENLQGAEFARSKDGYWTSKVKDILAGADMVVFGIDTKGPVLEMPKSNKAKLIDFNSHSSCTFESDYDFRNYVSNKELDSFVRMFSNEQVQDETFFKDIQAAELVVQEKLGLAIAV